MSAGRGSRNNSTGSNNSSSTSSYFTYPVKYAVSSALRRLPGTSSSPKSSVRSGNRTQHHEPYRDDVTAVEPSATGNLIDLDDDSSFFAPAPTRNESASYTPPPIRQQSYTPPFQPPPLTPLILRGFEPGSQDQVLNNAIAEEIRLLVPPRLQLCEQWQLMFSLELDGSSLNTLYSKCEAMSGKRAGCVLVVKDADGSIFGAYLTDPPHPSGGHYYGHGECFLWRSSILPAIPTLASLPPLPSEDTTHAQRMTTLGSPTKLRANGASTPQLSGVTTPERMRFKAFPYSGENDYLIFCEHGFLSVGGGNGHYGLWIDTSLENGISEPCPTFGNESLSDLGAKFSVIGVEVWSIGA